MNFGLGAYLRESSADYPWSVLEKREEYEYIH